MTTKTLRGLAMGTLGLSLAAGCDLGDRVTGQEMRQAMEEIVLTGDAQSLEDGVVELTTSFTIGDGVESIISEVRAFAESQVPCSTVDATDPGSVSIDFGLLEDACTYRGKTYAGVVTVAWEVGADEVVVTHDYEGLTNGRVTLDGEATVTWSRESRRVRTDLAFQGEAADIEVESDRTQTQIGGFGDGVRVVGTRDWTGPSGSWALDIDDVELRAVDPVPQAGTYTLTTPADKTLTLSFARVDEDTIEVSMAGGFRDRVFLVTAAGQISDGDD